MPCKFVTFRNINATNKILAQVFINTKVYEKESYALSILKDIVLETFRTYTNGIILYSLWKYGVKFWLFYHGLPKYIMIITILLYTIRLN